MQAPNNFLHLNHNADLSSVHGISFWNNSLSETESASRFFFDILMLDMVPTLSPLKGKKNRRRGLAMLSMLASFSAASTPTTTYTHALCPTLLLEKPIALSPIWFHEIYTRSRMWKRLLQWLPSLLKSRQTRQKGNYWMLNTWRLDREQAWNPRIFKSWRSTADMYKHLSSCHP